jgi:hypothetical protein
VSAGIPQSASTISTLYVQTWPSNEPLGLIVLPSLASASVWRKLPAPLSFVLVTGMVVAASTLFGDLFGELNAELSATMTNKKNTAAAPLRMI